MARTRRKSSNLGADPRGDTSAPAISTLDSSSRPDVPSVSAEKSLKPHSKRRKARSLLRRWKQVSLRHTWLNPLILIIIFLTAYAFKPDESNPLHYAIFLSYPLPPKSKGGPTMYGKGKCDFAFVGFYTIVLSFTREFLMQRVIRPMAIRAGLRTRAKIDRFMEQVYTAMYFAVFGPFGLYVMSRGPLWYFNTTEMFEGFPHREHEGLFKAYYLLQASYWLQQAIVLLLGLEAPRKDFKELVGHHIVTLALIGLSYRFHFANMGIAVYITHDVSDFFLATSKTLNYIDSPITAPYFALFMSVWIYMRHYLNLRILYATLTEFRTVGPFELNWDTQQYKCWISQYITFSLLACLQALNLFWLYLVVGIAKNYVMASGLSDSRSDDEGDDDEVVEETSTKSQVTRQDHGKPTILLNGYANGSYANGKDSSLKERKTRG